LLRQRALVNASENSGSIHIQGKQITFSDGAIALIQHTGTQKGNRVTLTSSESIQFLNSNLIPLRTGVRVEALGIGEGGDSCIFIPRLLLENGSTLLNFSYTSGGSGNIVVDAAESIHLIDTLPNDLSFNVSRIISRSVMGNSGNW
jgi:hypothetical protein